MRNFNTSSMFKNFKAKSFVPMEGGTEGDHEEPSNDYTNNAINKKEPIKREETRTIADSSVDEENRSVVDIRQRGTSSEDADDDQSVEVQKNGSRTVIEGEATIRRSRWGRRPRGEGCCCGWSDWTRRERVLLCVALFNSLLILILLAVNIAVLKRSDNESSNSFASSESPNDVIQWRNSWSCGGGVRTSSPKPAGAPTPSPPATQGTPTSSSVGVGDPSSPCGCASCTESIWDNMAGDFSCGNRILYLQNELSLKYPTQEHACRQVAFEFPCQCGGCDPGHCSLATPEFILPGDWVPPQGQTPAPTPIPQFSDPSVDQENQALYCFPSGTDRTQYSLWSGMVVQVKEDYTKACGPGNNRFQSSTVVADEINNKLTLLYTEGVASEVRVLLPKDQRPFTYGRYSFTVDSVQVKNATGAILSDVLPKELVLGLFTWDDTENYAVKENYNHEVDIEISRWNCETNSDLQFLVQPPGFPHLHRMFTGSDPKTNKYSQGGQVYSFDWNPGQIDWNTTASGPDNGRFTLKTEEALFRQQPDYIQCLPDVGGNMEVRINLWNFLGAVQPIGLAFDDVVEVVIGDFSFTPSGLEHIVTGGVCSKHCQCEAGVAMCLDGICTPT